MIQDETFKSKEEQNKIIDSIRNDIIEKTKAGNILDAIYKIKDVYLGKFDPITLDSIVLVEDSKDYKSIINTLGESGYGYKANLLGNNCELMGYIDNFNVRGWDLEGQSNE